MSDKKLEQIGDHIKRALFKRGKTQTWLGEQFEPEKSRTQINKWCQNVNTPSPQNLKKVADILDYTVQELMTGNFRDERTVVDEEFDDVVEGYISNVLNTADILANSTDLDARAINAHKQSIRSNIELALNYVRSE